MALQVGASIVSVRRRVGHFGRASSELHPKAGRFSMGFAFGFQWRAVHADHDLDLRAKVSNLSVVLVVRKLSPHLECGALFRFTDSRMRGGAFVVRCYRRALSNRATKEVSRPSHRPTKAPPHMPSRRMRKGRRTPNQESHSGLWFDLYHAYLLKQPQVIGYILDWNEPVRRCDVVANRLYAALAVYQIQNLVHHDIAVGSRADLLG